jgi:hypothetical protein
VDIPRYPSTALTTDDSTYKAVFAHIDYTVPVVTGISTTQFTVSLGNAGKFFVGAMVRIHNADFSIDSGDASVSAVVGTTITVGTSLGFTPAAGQFIDLIGFADGGGAYRFI